MRHIGAWAFGLMAAFASTAVAAPSIAPSPGPGWKTARADGTMAIYYRDGATRDARELRVISEVDAPPEAVFAVVTDFANYPKFMPYTKEAQVLKRLGPDKVLVYTLSNPPIIAHRDLVAQITMTRGTTENGGVFRSDWVARPELTPLKPGVVRIKLSTGYWLMTPEADGHKTRLTYSVLTSPGGSIPRVFADSLTNDGMVNLFEAVRKQVAGKSQK